MTIERRNDRIALRDSQLHRKGISLVEVMAAVVIIGIISAIAISYYGESDLETRRNACFVNRGDIELQVRLWTRDLGFMPATDLSDLGANTSRFPSGIPVCPVDGTPYTINSNGIVVGHSH